METIGTVLIAFGAVIALVLGLLIATGVLPLDRYIEGYEDRVTRDKRARERRLRESSGSPAGRPSTTSHDTPQA